MRRRKAGNGIDSDQSLRMTRLQLFAIEREHATIVCALGLKNFCSRSLSSR
jgi:hypothetical protein